MTDKQKKNTKIGAGVVVVLLLCAGAAYGMHRNANTPHHSTTHVERTYHHTVLHKHVHKAHKKAKKSNKATKPASHKSDSSNDGTSKNASDTSSHHSSSASSDSTSSHKSASADGPSVDLGNGINGTVGRGAGQVYVSFQDHGWNILVHGNDINQPASTATQYAQRIANSSNLPAGGGSLDIDAAGGGANANWGNHSASGSFGHVMNSIH